GHGALAARRHPPIPGDRPHAAGSTRKGARGASRSRRERLAARPGSRCGPAFRVRRWSTPGIGLAQELIGLLHRSRRVGAAENHLRAEAASALATALDVLAEVQRHYSAVQALEDLGSVLQQRVETVERLRQVADARLGVGEGTRADLVAFEIEKKSVEIEAAER